jgi:hypothetical protein
MGAEPVTVPDDVTPEGVDLAMTAILLRAGIHGQEVPSYGEKAWLMAIAVVAERQAFRPFRRPTDSSRGPQTVRSASSAA